MKRRSFLKNAAAGVAASTVAAPAIAQSQPAIQWRLAASWPKSLDTLFGGADLIARRVSEVTDGKFQIRTFAAGEIVPATQVLDAIQAGTVELGHTAAYYYFGKDPAFSMATSIPFGGTARQNFAWWMYGGGLELWKEAYAPFGVLPMPGGNSGTQMGGWFRKEIKSLDDLKGLKMRIPGLGGEALQRAGGTPVTLAGGEIFTALETGAIDATEWIGPYNDLAFGLYKAAKFYYYPGWHEPGSSLEAIINQQAFDSLPADLQEIVLTCCHVINETMNAEFVARNSEALQSLVNDHDVELRRFPDDVLRTLRELSYQVIEEGAASDPFYARVYESLRAYQERSAAYLKVAEEAYLQARSL